MKKILQQLFEQKTLSQEQAREVIINMAQKQYNEAQIAAFITVYLMRTISVDELKGFREALLELCVPAHFDEPSIDMCGTGGDGKNTFNISTLASFVVAGAGYKVTKHGNYGVSSACGSSNVMEYFGYRFSNDLDTLKRQLDQSNICFLHAPLFHPALKTVGPIRQLLGVKTFFNMLGPLVNPAQPKHQLVGVFNLELARQYHYIYQHTDKQYAIIHALDGYDEVSLTSKVAVRSNHSELTLMPSDFGMKPLQQSDIYGGETIKDSAFIFKNILENKGTTAQNNAVIANAALGIQCFKPEYSLAECVNEARVSLESGKAKMGFDKLLNI